MNRHPTLPTWNTRNGRVGYTQRKEKEEKNKDYSIYESNREYKTMEIINNIKIYFSEKINKNCQNFTSVDQEKKKKEKSVKLLKSRMKERTSLTTLQKLKEIIRAFKKNNK